MKKLPTISDATIKRWLHNNGEKRTAYRFDWMNVDRRAKVRARVKAAIRAELAKGE